MLTQVTPNPQHLRDAARNIRPARMPIYEHIINPRFMERATGKEFRSLIHGGHADKLAYFRHYTAFFRDMGYDCVSFESGANAAYPGGGALGRHVDPAIKTRADFDRYPWDRLPELYQELAWPQFAALEEALPPGALCVGGVGNGVFEGVQDVTGYQNLCLLAYDDPDLYEALFGRVRAYLAEIWKRTLARWGHLFAVCRTGDDLGFRTQTLISDADIRRLVVPGYAAIADLVHAAGKPYLLHSCGCVFCVMDDIINNGRIDAKHSNEDQIAPYSRWVSEYAQRIGLFGGLDLNVLYLESEQTVRQAVRGLIELTRTARGYALGSGNSIPDDVPVANYMAMVDEANRYRRSQEAGL